ncbi:MAG: hypothetical protein RLZZ200_619 [Pseudomonadota bacterium]
MAQAHGLPPVRVVLGPTQGFRLRARLAIRGRRHAPKIGLFEAGSHRVVTIPSCSVQHPLINHAAAVVRRALVDAGVAPYSDQAREGVARYLQVVVERSSQRAQVVLVGHCEHPEPLKEALDLIAERLGDDLHSLWFNANTGQGNAILGPRSVKWHGADTVVETFGGARIHYPPGAFGQSNLGIAERIVEHLRASLIPDASVAEFYAGVGAIGLSLIGSARRLVLNEVSPASLEGLARGIDDLSHAERQRVAVVEGPGGGAVHALDGVEAVIVDPPRKGLDAPLRDALAARAPKQLLYVSCSLDSLRQDVAALTKEGGLKLTGLTAFNLMPFTAHVETVAAMERA